MEAVEDVVAAVILVEYLTNQEVEPKEKPVEIYEKVHASWRQPQRREEVRP